MIKKEYFISITGPSGSGKTTILTMIGCIDTPTGGTVEIASVLASKPQVIATAISASL